MRIWKRPFKIHIAGLTQQCTTGKDFSFSVITRNALSVCFSVTVFFFFFFNFLVSADNKTKNTENSGDIALQNATACRQLLIRFFAFLWPLPS